MRSQDYLRQIAKIDKLIENKLIEKEQWKAIATGTTASSEGERVQASGSQQKMADAVCKYIEIEEEINQCIDRFVSVKQDVIRTIEQLPPVEYDILHKVYIQYKQLYEVADIYRKSYTWAKSTHGRALKSVQKILDERGQKNGKPISDK